MVEREYFSNPEFEELVDKGSGSSRKLILHNDDVHSFDFVIESLVEICEVDIVQAEQITYLVHYKGKCDVKKGDFDYLKPYKEGLVDRGLEVTID